MPHFSSNLHISPPADPASEFVQDYPFILRVFAGSSFAAGDSWRMPSEVEAEFQLLEERARCLLHVVFQLIDEERPFATEVLVDETLPRG